MIPNAMGRRINFMDQNYTRRYRKYASRTAHINRVPNTERPGRLQTFTFRDRLFTSLRHQTVFLSEEQFRNLLETKVRKESVNMHQEWEEAYRAAVLETDHNRLIDKIDSATTVLRKSLLEASSPREHIGERERIEDALRTLDMIRRTELQIPA